ncbi:MFS transporter, AAHS family, 3-hydroxyphenylpropionic acid transporter [Sphingobium sp. AP50]|uniref:MFS transporter n=1 Tax=Sphingobium sp. AP50 TaxID=1884369 RepID=UPI0008CCB76D|nr:MFS transporter [Sphingobium sp. AP50]SEJ80407.1 MFS transporter, AAHS family, 3-hydroxyphenylpropionic acid transporter [Sphingobium sp. AP50]
MPNMFTGSGVAGVITSRLKAPRLLFFAVILGIFEGTDIASMGMTLSRISRALDLNPTQSGLCASASMAGLMVGALIGGRLADIRGRRSVMISSIALMGVFSIATALSWSFTSLFAFRLCTGLGMGGLMPLLIAMANDSAHSSFRSTAISIVLASGPIGGFVAALVAAHPDWRMLFLFGGIGPMLVMPLVLAYLPVAIFDPGTRLSAPKRRSSLVRTYFADGRTSGTLLIWAIAFATAIVVFVTLNWLPSLLVRQGISEAQTSKVMLAFSLGGIIGNIVAGVMMDRGSSAALYALGYIGAGLCLSGIAIAPAGAGIYVLAAGINFFILGALLVTYSLAPIHYPVNVRASGIGGMIAAGRLGSVFGPVLAGQLLQAGFAPQTVLLALLPALGVSLVFGLGLERRLRRGVPPQS